MGLQPGTLALQGGVDIQTSTAGVRESDTNRKGVEGLGQWVQNCSQIPLCLSGGSAPLSPTSRGLCLTHSLAGRGAEPGSSCAVAPAVAPVPGLASQVPPAADHGTRLWERDFESLGLPKKRTGV